MAARLLARSWVARFVLEPFKVKRTEPDSSLGSAFVSGVGADAFRFGEPPLGDPGFLLSIAGSLILVDETIGYDSKKRPTDDV